MVARPVVYARSLVEEVGDRIAHLPDWGWFTPILLFLAAVAAAYVLSWFLNRWGGRLAARTKTPVDDILVKAVRGPLLVMGVVIGASLALAAAPALHPRFLRAADLTLTLVGIYVLAVVAIRITRGLLNHYGTRNASLRPTVPLLTRLAVAAIVVAAALTAFSAFGISIAPLLTTLGIAGLILGLALQDTLGNFFAGLYLNAERPLEVGHYVRLPDSNIEGFVVSVGWRSTRIRELRNTVVVVPNSHLTSNVFINYTLPEPRMSLLVPVSVAYGSDPDQVERLLVEEALEAARQLPGLLSEPAPFVRFIPGFGRSSLDFTLICQVREFVDNFEAQHVLRKRILARLTREGIAIPPPTELVQRDSRLALDDEERPRAL